MALHKLADFDQNYRESFQGNDIKGMDVYTEQNQKIGTVTDAFVDEDGRFRYLVVDLGFWIFGKKVLLPVGRARFDYNADRVYATGMTREQAENLPEYNENTALDYDYEERVRGNYRTAATGVAASPSPTAYTRESYKYEQDQPLYDLNEQDHQTLKLYEERLIANKRRMKTGEVAVGKRVETETQQVSIPVEKERVVIERTTPSDAGRAVAPGEAAFREGEVAHVEIYEETADVQKEAFVREEVNIRKEVERDTVQTEETIRREELDIDTQGRTIDERTGRRLNDRV